MKKFCPKCGADIAAGTFCSTCNPSTLDFKQIKLKLCPSGKYFFKGKWKSFNSLSEVTKKVLEKSLSKKVVLVEGLEVYDDLLNKTGLKKDFPVVIIVDDEQYELPLSVEVTSSPEYSKVGTDYFEGILQVRNVDLEKKRRVFSLVEKEGAYVNKVIEGNKSVDFYFVKKKFIGRVAEKIVDEFGGVADYNAQLFSQDKQSSKELFRLNVAVHIPDFSKGDVVFFKDSLILIKSLGKQISGFDFLSNKNISFKYDPSINHEFVIVEKQKTKIMTTHPLTALSTKSYELVDLENPLDINVKKDQNVSIVEYNGFAYLIK